MECWNRHVKTARLIKAILPVKIQTCHYTSLFFTMGLHSVSEIAFCSPSQSHVAACYIYYSHFLSLIGTKMPDSPADSGTWQWTGVWQRQGSSRELTEAKYGNQQKKKMFRNQQLPSSDTIHLTLLQIHLNIIMLPNDKILKYRTNI